MWSLIQSKLKSWSVIDADDSRTTSRVADKRPTLRLADNRPTPRDESNRPPSEVADNRPISRTDDNGSTSKIESNKPNLWVGFESQSRHSFLKNVIPVTSASEKENTETSRQTLIVNTPSFKGFNGGGDSIFHRAFTYLGKSGFRFTLFDEEYAPYLFGELNVNAASEIYYNVKSEYRLGDPGLLGVFCDPRSQGMYMGLRDVFPDLTVSAKGGVMLTSHNVETALLTQYVKENLHVTSAISYSQESTEGNKFHADAVLRYADFLYGYAWLGKLVQSDTSSVAHENQFSLGYTGVDYAVTYMTNLTLHKFMFYNEIMAGLEQAFAITLDTSMVEVFTELGCRWRITDDDAITVKIDGDHFLSAGLEKNLDDNVTLKLAASFGTWDEGFLLGFGLEYYG